MDPESDQQDNASPYWTEADWQGVRSRAGLADPSPDWMR